MQISDAKLEHDVGYSEEGGGVSAQTSHNWPASYVVNRPRYVLGDQVRLVGSLTDCHRAGIVIRRRLDLQRHAVFSTAGNAEADARECLSAGWVTKAR